MILPKQKKDNDIIQMKNKNIQTEIDASFLYKKLAAGLFLIGAATTLFTGKNVWYPGF